MHIEYKQNGNGKKFESEKKNIFHYRKLNKCIMMITSESNDILWHQWSDNLKFQEWENGRCYPFKHKFQSSNETILNALFSLVIYMLLERFWINQRTMVVTGGKSILSSFFLLSKRLGKSICILFFFFTNEWEKRDFPFLFVWISFIFSFLFLDPIDFPE